MEFQPDPLLTLDQSQTLELIAQPYEYLPDSLVKFRIKSPWLCTLLNHRSEVSGFQSNATFQAWFETQFQVGPFSRNASVLATLIYNAQRYRRHDKLVAAGWVPGSQELLDEAFNNSKEIEYLPTAAFANPSPILLTVRKKTGTVQAFKRRKQTPLDIDGKPVRIPQPTIP